MNAPSPVPVVTLACALLASAAQAGEARPPIAHEPPMRTLPEEADDTTNADADGDQNKGGAMRIAVYDLEFEGVEDRTARVLTDSVLFEVRKLDRVSAIGMTEVRAMLDLEAQKQLVGCSAEDSCLADIAGALGVDGLVIGSVAQVGEEHVFSLKRIDQRRAATVGDITKRLPAGDGEELLGAVGEMVGSLFPEYQLRTGQVRGVDPALGRRLNPPPLPPWVFWTGVGATGLLLASAGVAGGSWLVFQGDYRTLADRSATAFVEGVALKDAGGRAQTAEVIGWSLLGSSVGAGAVSGVLALFTDFYGYGEDAQ